MEQVELLYINFLEHPFLQGLELNFSQEIAFKLTDEKQLITEKLESKGMFNNAITNLNIIVGKNGVGKTTILNEIYELLHGSVQKDKIVAIRKEKIVYIYFNNNAVKISIEELDNVFGEYYFKLKRDGFYLEPHNSLKSLLDPEIKNLIYISEFTDLSINSSTHKYENNHAFNFSPMVLINSPDYFLNFINQTKNNLQKTISNFRLISKIHQIEFLTRNKFKFSFKVPDYIQFHFNGFLFRIEKRYNAKENKKRNELDQLLLNLLQRGNKNSLRYIFDIHLTLSLFNLLDISRYIFDEEKARKMLYPYKDVNNSIIEEEWSNCLKEYKDGVKSILTGFSLGNLTVIELYKKYISLINKTKITTYYSSEDSEEIDLIDKVKQLITSYQNIISLKNEHSYRASTSLNLPLLEAATFFRNYLVLRNYTDTFNQVSICMPDDIIYLYGERNFYFSSGEEQLLRLFTYIDLSVDYIEKYSEEEEHSFIILLDEPDNAFHPEMQKEFIKDINSFLNQYNSTTFHVILTSHSPIITSDLTKNHVLFLKKEIESHSIRSLDNNKKPYTFAQNIYNLYKESFYIEDGLIGSYAEEVLSGIYRQLSNKKTTDKLINTNKEINGRMDREGTRDYEDYNIQDGIMYTVEEISFYIREIGEPILKKKFEEIFNPNKKRDLLKEILEKHDLPSDVKKDLISLILKDEEHMNDRD
ncbi:AAA family ATPase [Cytobacillus praedii]|uniref:AAA family ATPase n=1 Tax=Cytobacillus praedii TaxID=1742358 RepID=UPI002E21F1F6|nr:AAA family ATPase [Cytobacillus praedii]